MPISLEVKLTGKLIIKLKKIYRSKIAGSVIKKMIFAARITGIDPSSGRASVPFIDRSVKLDPWIGTGPSTIADVIPKLF
jgi:hypothetical protein